MAATFGRSLGSVTPADTANAVLTTTAVANVGERIVVQFAWWGAVGPGTVTGVTDSAGNTYVNDGSGLDGIYMGTWSAPVTTQLPSGGTITVAISNGGDTWINVAAMALVNAAAAESANRYGDDDATLATTATALSAASGVVVACAAMRSGTDFTFTAGGSFTKVAETKGGNINFATEYREVTSAGSYNASGTWSGTDTLDGQAMHVIYPELITTTPQKVRPVADGDTDGFSPSTGGSIWATIDESTPSETDYAVSVTSPDGKKFREKLGVLNPPPAGTKTIHIRPYKASSGGETHSGIVRLYEGGSGTFGSGSLIQTFNLGALDEVANTIDLTVTNTITSWWDLWVEYEVDVT